MAESRVTAPIRNQGVIRFEMPDDALEAGHPARVLWQALGKLDLPAFVARARSIDGRAGRQAHSPHMMLTLWAYAISQGVGSAREIERMTHKGRACRWILGGGQVGHHALSRFRVGHRDAHGAEAAPIFRRSFSRALRQFAAAQTSEPQGPCGVRCESALA